MKTKCPKQPGCFSRRKDHRYLPRLKIKPYITNGRAQHALKMPWFFFFFPLFPSCPFHVPNGFAMCSPRVFPIAPHFNPICLAQSPPLLIYIAGPKGEVLHLSIESSILGSLLVSSFSWLNQLAHCVKTKVGLVKHPQLINMKQNR